MLLQGAHKTELMSAIGHELFVVNEVVLINEVNQHQAWLVTGWVNHQGM